MNGVDEVRAAADGFTPEAVADFCRVPADTIRRIAHELAAAERGAVYGRIGLCNQEFGTLASWLVDVVNILTGHFDAEGGMMFGKPVTEPLTWKADTKVMGEPRVRPLDQPGARRPRGARPGAVLVPGRGDRHAGRGPAQGAHHHRRQPGDQRPRLGPARGGAAAARVHDLRSTTT